MSHRREVVAVHESGEEAWCPTCTQQWPCAAMRSLTETAARAMFAEEQCDRRQKGELGKNWLSRLNDDDRAEYSRLALAAIEAVMPILQAAAWHDGYEDGANAAYNDGSAQNPYADATGTLGEITDEALRATNEEVRAATNRVAAAIVEHMEPELDWGDMPSEDHRELYREVARAAIQALVSAPEQDHLRRIPTYANCATCDGGGCGDCS